MYRVNVCPLQPIKMKEISLFEFMDACLYIILMISIEQWHTCKCQKDLKMLVKGWKLQPCNTHLFFLPVYYPTSPSEVDHIIYWYRKAEKPERLMDFKKQCNKFLNILVKQIARKLSSYDLRMVTSETGLHSFLIRINLSSSSLCMRKDWQNHVRIIKSYIIKNHIF